MVRVVGFEPTASCFQGRSSGLTELHPVSLQLALRREIESLSPDRQSGRLTRCVTEQIVRLGKAARARSTFRSFLDAVRFVASPMMTRAPFAATTEAIRQTHGRLTMISGCRATGLARKLLTVALLLLAMRPAVALEERDLVGWWIAIDRTFPDLYVTGRVPPMEELVVIDDQGRVEDRLMMFRGVDAQWCIDRKVQCSDAPLMARARVVVAGDQLTFTEVAAAENRIDDRPEIDWGLRPLTVTSTRSWTLSPGANGGVLTLRPNLLDTSRPAA